MGETITAMKIAFAAFSSGKAEVPLRSRLLIPPHEAISFFMPAYLQDQDREALAVKIVSVYPHNAAAGLPLIHGAILVMEASTGRPIALLEGGGLTATRTGAASGAATDILARKDSQVAAIFGAGVQGRAQLEAICTVRSIQTAWIYDPDQSQVSQFLEEMAGYSPIPADIRPANNPQQAVSEADIICCATTSQTPVFEDRHLKSGVHINAVGSYTEEMQEIPAETIQRSMLVVDSRQAVLSETGDILKPLQSGLIDEGHIYAELGELVLGQITGRKNASNITCFKSVGNAVQDAAAAQLALQTAHQLGIGHQVDW
jgi:ornithine cyclodeaminase/alanine dehydrogenase-like protein (mu-crystallin family)